MRCRQCGHIVNETIGGKCIQCISTKHPKGLRSIIVCCLITLISIGVFLCL